MPYFASFSPFATVPFVGSVTIAPLFYGVGLGGELLNSVQPQLNAGRDFVFGPFDPRVFPVGAAPFLPVFQDALWSNMLQYRQSILF